MLSTGGKRAQNHLVKAFKHAYTEAKHMHGASSGCQVSSHPKAEILLAP